MIADGERGSEGQEGNLKRKRNVRNSDDLLANVLILKCVVMNNRIKLAVPIFILFLEIKLEMQGLNYE